MAAPCIFDLHRLASKIPEETIDVRIAHNVARTVFNRNQSTKALRQKRLLLSKPLCECRNETVTRTSCRCRAVCTISVWGSESSEIVDCVNPPSESCSAISRLPHGHRFLDRRTSIKVVETGCPCQLPEIQRTPRIQSSEREQACWLHHHHLAAIRGSASS